MKSEILETLTGARTSVRNPSGATLSGKPFANGPALALLIALIIASVLVAIALVWPMKEGPAAVGVVLGALSGAMAFSFLAASAVRVVDQWEKAIVLRLGRFKALKGPGLFFVVPIIDTVPKVVDQRIRATDFAAETCLTKDTVPVNVDAIAFWIVWDAQKSVLTRA